MITSEIIEGPKLRHGKFGKHVTHFPSRKNGKTVTCESLLEADFCLELERAASVTHYEAQPFSIRIAGTKKKYTPDFAAYYANGDRVVYELKNVIAYHDLEVRKRLSFYAELLATHNYLLEPICESSFRIPTRTKNLRLLYVYGYHTKSPEADPLLHALDKHHQLSVETALNLNISQKAIAYAVFYGLVEADLTRPFRRDSLIFRATQHV